MSNRILSFYQESKSLIQGKMVIPRMVSVWLSQKCNLNCGYCGFSSTHDGTLIDSNKFRLLLKEFADLRVESIELSGGGEPTIHKECFEFAEYISGFGMKVGMLTNGFRFDLDRIKYFDYIRVGLDAIDKESYSKIKGVHKGVFNEVVDNIKSVVGRRNEDIMVKPVVGVKFIINENNYRNMQDFINYGYDLKVDYVSFRGLFGENSSNELDEANLIFDDMKESWDDFIQGSFSFDDLIYPCFMAPIHAVITADGNLLNCCYFNDADHVIGNVFEKPFKKLWFSDRHWKVLESIPQQECNKHTCRFRDYNNRMGNLLDGKELISFI